MANGILVKDNLVNLIAKIGEKIKVVDDILDRIEARQERIYIFNKIDKLSGYELAEIKKRYRDKKPFYISTYNKHILIIISIDICTCNSTIPNLYKWSFNYLIKNA